MAEPTQFTPKETMLIRMILALALKLGLGADDLAESYLRGDELQAYHDCFAGIVGKAIDEANTTAQVVKLPNSSPRALGAGAQTKENKTMYQFKINDIANLDLGRIAQENFDAGIPVTALPLKKGALLIIANDFLSQFRYDDKQIVAGERLYSTWGYELANVHFELSGLVYSSCHALPIKGARCKYTTGNLGQIGEALRAASEFKRSIKVTVLQFKPAARFG